MTLEELYPYRNAIHQLVAQYHLQNPRVFGSMAENCQTANSDIDFLVDATEQTTLFDMGGLQQALSQLLCTPVDVVTPEDLHINFRKQVVSTAKPI